eukprot:scaffold32685_cov33-Tisochrysis_lutea.AAC.4
MRHWQKHASSRRVRVLVSIGLAVRRGSIKPNPRWGPGPSTHSSSKSYCRSTLDAITRRSIRDARRTRLTLPHYHHRPLPVTRTTSGITPNKTFPLFPGFLQTAQNTN